VKKAIDRDRKFRISFFLGFETMKLKLKGCKTKNFGFKGCEITYLKVAGCETKKIQLKRV
jgi:hypothetical protein